MLISIGDESQRSNLEETLMDTVYNGFSSLFVPWEIAVLHFLQRALTIDSLQKKVERKRIKDFTTWTTIGDSHTHNSGKSQKKKIFFRS